MELFSAYILCAGDRAWVFTPHENGGRPDIVTVYHRSGEVGTLELPTEYTGIHGGCRTEVRAPDGRVMGERPCSVWSQNLQPSWDDRGNLVVFGFDRETAGAIIDHRNGCYALVRKNYSDDFAKRPVRIVGDSALVFELASEVRPDGTPLVYGSSAYRVSMHPLRRIGGEPCPGIP